MTDAAALEAFERLVLEQQPASAPWAPPVGVDYSFEARKQIEGKHPELIRDVFQPREVLDVGCGRGHLVVLLGQVGVSAQGMDVQWPERCHFWRGDITRADCVRWPMGYDLVICREVLEHLTLREIHRAVTNLCALTSKYLYITTRFHLAPTHLLDVMTADDLDPTHISMTNQTWLRHRIVLEGFKRRPDLETAMDWQGKGRCLVYERAV